MEKILIATDFSPAANNAVYYGADLAKFFNAEIILLHAFSLPVGGFNSLSPINVIGELQSAGIEALNELRNKVIRRTGFDPGIECVCEPGSAFGVISDYIASHRVDLVVMGIVGQAGALKKQLIGSSAISAARNLQLPLLIVPEKAAYKRISKISFACDLNHTEDSTLLHTARYFAKVFDASLEIVRVNLNKTEPVPSERTSAFLEKTLQTVEHQVTIIDGEQPAQTLSQHFSEHKTDLVLINPKKHSLFHALFIPGTTQQLAFRSELPLLAIH